MSLSTTSSVRLPDELRRKLDRLSAQLHRGKNWIMTEALKRYLASMDDVSLQKEARRQSLRASRAVAKEDKAWEASGDTEGWQ